jgi:DnaJ-class molecular chaperone
MSEKWPAFWKCRECYGTGKVIRGYDRVAACEKCDGTGNAMVDGAEGRHKRRINELEGKSP